MGLPRTPSWRAPSTTTSEGVRDALPDTNPHLALSTPLHDAQYPEEQRPITETQEALLPARASLPFFFPIWLLRFLSLPHQTGQSQGLWEQNRVRGLVAGGPPSILSCFWPTLEPTPFPPSSPQGLGLYQPPLLPPKRLGSLIPHPSGQAPFQKVPESGPLVPTHGGGSGCWSRCGSYTCLRGRGSPQRGGSRAGHRHPE